MSSLVVLAWDDSGDRRVPHQLDEGDLIEWKRNGYTGYCWGRVDCLRDDGAAKPIRIMPYLSDKSGPSGSRMRWISKLALMRVYDSKGNRKRPSQH